MRNPSSLSVAVLGLIAIAFASGRADAAFITYTQTVVASGSLGGSTFTNATVTFTQTADTDDIGMLGTGIILVPGATSTVAIAGLGVANFAFPTYTYTRVGGSAVGIALSGGSGAGGVTSIVPIVSIASPSLSGYDLKGPIGPVTGTIAEFSGSSVGTSTDRGNFMLTSALFAGATFQAAVVPEPSSLLLCGMGLAGLGLWRSRPRAAAARPSGPTPGDAAPLG